MKRFIVVLLVLFLAVGMTTAQNLEVLWMGWPKDQVMPLINEFQAKNPGIKIDIQLIPFGQLFQTIEVRLASGGGTPDVYIVDGPNTASYAARKSICCLSMSTLARRKKMPGSNHRSRREPIMASLFRFRMEHRRQAYSLIKRYSKNMVFHFPRKKYQVA
jgi:hypothetical protein